GNGSVIRPGDAQRMSAGRGIRHSEFNASQQTAVHFLQIWLLPAAVGIDPGYEQRNFPVSTRRERLRLVASADGDDDSITIHQDARMYDGIFDAGEGTLHQVPAQRRVYLQVARGNVQVNEVSLGAGDGAAIENERSLEFKADSDSEVVLFD